jgi:hypothetical protein
MKEEIKTLAQKKKKKRKAVLTWNGFTKKSSILRPFVSGLALQPSKNALN